MPNIFDNITRYTGPVGKAVLSMAGPGILKGILLEYFTKEKMDVKTISAYVVSDTDLWSKLPDQYSQRLRNLIAGIDLRWLTPEWLVTAITEDYPAIASLFLGWPEAKEWLDKQVSTIRSALTAR